MANDSPWKKLQEEATCSICWKYYTKPFILDCGHSFCKDCISQFWKLFLEATTCPQCRTPVESKNCYPNTSLSNVVEIAKLSNSVTKKVDEGKKVCEKHPEPSRTVFCVEDQIIFCQECEESEQHKNHNVTSLEETTQLYKGWYFGFINSLKKERTELVKKKACLVEWVEQLEKRSVTESQTIAACFKRLREFLSEREKYLVRCLESVSRKIAEKRNRHHDLASLSLDIFYLENDIRLLEEKASQPTLEFLQDAMQTFYRCQNRRKWTNVEDTSMELKWGVWELIELSAVMEGLVNFYKETLLNALCVTRANVTLDSNSNHPRLLLSFDGKSVKWQHIPTQLFLLPQRFDKVFCVLGCQGFRAGRHFWEVMVRGQGNWAVGVAKRSVQRKGVFCLCTKEGVFAVGKLQEQYRVINMPDSPVLPLDGELRWIQVCLNCSARQVNFYDVEKAMRICSFTDIGSFEETYLPFFWLHGDIQLTITT